MKWFIEHSEEDLQLLGEDGGSHKKKRKVDRNTGGEGGGEHSNTDSEGCKDDNTDGEGGKHSNTHSGRGKGDKAAGGGHGKGDKAAGGSGKGDKEVEKVGTSGSNDGDGIDRKGMEERGLAIIKAGKGAHITTAKMMEDDAWCIDSLMRSGNEYYRNKDYIRAANMFHSANMVTTRAFDKAYCESRKQVESLQAEKGSVSTLRDQLEEQGNEVARMQGEIDNLTNSHAREVDDLKQKIEELKWYKDRFENIASIAAASMPKS